MGVRYKLSTARVKIINIKDGEISFEKASRIVLVVTLGIILFSYSHARTIYGYYEEISKSQKEVQGFKRDIVDEKINSYLKPQITSNEEPFRVGRVSDGVIEGKNEIVSKKELVSKVGKSDSDLRSILEGYGRAGSPFGRSKIAFVYSEAKKRNLNAKLVLAVMAKESGWGKSYYCMNKGNCFGYGYTDSGKVGNYEGSFKETTEKILDAYKRQGYGKTTAQDMASRGYNFHKEWVIGVNSIIGSFK